MPHTLKHASASGRVPCVRENEVAGPDVPTTSTGLPQIEDAPRTKDVVVVVLRNDNRNIRTRTYVVRACRRRGVPEDRTRARLCVRFVECFHVNVYNRLSSASAHKD